MKKCHICKSCIKGEIYTCCKQTKFYCLKCNVKICWECRSLPQSCKKQKLQIPYRSYLTCSSCKQQRSLILYQFFQQKNCKYNFCYQCLISLYQKYFKTLQQIAAQQGIRPEFPFQLPCRCQLLQNQIITFLQKSCYCCSMKIGSDQSYKLCNKLRVTKNCIRKLEANPKLSFYKQENQKFKRLAKMILKCQGCDSLLDSTLSNQQNLNVCKKCVLLNKLEVKILEKEQQEKQSAKKQLQDVEIQVKLIKPQAKIKQNNNSYNKNEMIILKEQEMNLLNKIEQPQESKIDNQYKKVQEDKATLKVIELPEKSIFQDIVQPKTLNLSSQIFQSLKECKQCSIILQVADLIPRFLQRNGSNHLTIENNHKNEKQYGLQEQNICKLCYFQAKTKQKIIERQNKLLQKMDRSKLYKSTHKTQKKVENINNIFSRFDYHYESSAIPKKLQTQKNSEAKNIPETTSSFLTTSNNFMFQKCLKCSARVYLTQFNKKKQQCHNCQSQALEIQNKAKKEQKIIEINCRICKQLKKLKQSEKRSLGYCKECSFVIYGRK